MRTKHGKKAGFERHIDELVVVSNTLGKSNGHRATKQQLQLLVNAPV